MAEPPPVAGPPTFTDQVVTWYAGNARDLPWRRPGTAPWGVLVSEVMLQQTQVHRVIPVWGTWTTRWPSPAALAAEPVAAAVRAWGRLGYPRRALRLHGAATACVRRHGGMVPDEVEALRALPGVGPYTAAAVCTFAFGQRHPVLDTNVRRVLARALHGQRCAGQGPVRVAERSAAEQVLPLEPAAAAAFSVAVMELGATVCTAFSPRCGSCPVAEQCAWLAVGRPAGPAVRAGKGYLGTDRHARGLLLAVLREFPEVARDVLDRAVESPDQRERALASLLADGLAEQTPEGLFRLPL